MFLLLCPADNKKEHERWALEPYTCPMLIGLKIGPFPFIIFIKKHARSLFIFVFFFVPKPYTKRDYKKKPRLLLLQRSFLRQGSDFSSYGSCFS